MDNNEPYVLYLVKALSFDWWDTIARLFLETRGWNVENPATFSYEAFCGVKLSDIMNPADSLQFRYFQKNASVVTTFRGEPTGGSIFDSSVAWTVIEDLLAFMSLYSGIYCQHLWKERRLPTGEQVKPAFLLSYSEERDAAWAADRAKSMEFFERALTTIPTLNKKQFNLSIRWFFSALWEFEIGRPLVESALNWVTLESQANYLKLRGSKKQKVQALLGTQGFQTIPRLDDLYRLRNDAYHDGQLSNLTELEAQNARTAGRVLVRAQILNVLGMEHKDFDQRFVGRYTR